MQVHNVELTISAVRADQYPSGDQPEIAFVGRSNVGKSSLTNVLINRRNYAHTSSQPGKTQTLNFYHVEDQLYFVDVPGYGFAKVSKKERERFGRMIEAYLTKRQQLRGVVLLVDARHQPTDDDVTMYNYLKYYQLPTLVVGTKSDKLNVRSSDPAGSRCYLAVDRKNVLIADKRTDGKLFGLSPVLFTLFLVVRLFLRVFDFYTLHFAFFAVFWQISKFFEEVVERTTLPGY